MKDKLIFLEGLRGVAALIVFLNHIQLTFEEKALTHLLTFLEEELQSYLLSHLIHGGVNVLFNGEFAVYVFWFLSAYVISIKLFVTTGNSYLIKASVKRYFRLSLPVLGSVGLAFFLLKLGAMHNTELYKGNTEHWISGLYQFSANPLIAVKSALWNTFFDPGGSETYNAVLWTMQPELYGSLLCFLIYAVLRQSKYRSVIYVALILIYLYFSKYYIITFLLGFWLCDLDFSHAKSRLVAAINFALGNQKINKVLFSSMVILAGFPNYYGLFYIPASGIIVLLVLRTKAVQKILQSKFMMWLGKISFSLYLLHLPIICSFSCYLYLQLPFEHITKLLIVTSSTVALTFLSAAIFSKYVDRAAIGLGTKIGTLVSR